MNIANATTGVTSPNHSLPCPSKKEAGMNPVKAKGNIQVIKLDKNRGYRDRGKREYSATCFTINGMEVPAFSTQNETEVVRSKTEAWIMVLHTIIIRM
jgi:hypothetical protein